MAAIAATTRRIRIGSAGVMLPHYSALKVAEQFRVLEAHRAGAHRPGRGPRARIGPADGVRAQSARQRGRRVSAAGARAAVLGRGDCRWPTIIPFAASRRSRRARPVPRSGFSAAPTTGRGSPRISACPMRSPISSATAQGVDEALTLYRRNYRPSARYPAADRDDLRVGACRRHRSRSAAPADDARILARGLRAGPAPSAGLARAGGSASLLRHRSGRASTSCAARPSSAPRSRWPRASRRWRSASSSTSSSSTPGRSIPPRAVARTSCWRRRSGSESRLRMRGADALVRSLVNAGVRHVFTLSGNHIMSVFDAALDVGLDLVHTRHEAATVHMADAWARITGEPGIALVTGGPGHANALSALYTAQMAESPVVLLSGHSRRTTSRDAARSRRCGRPRWRRP